MDKLRHAYDFVNMSKPMHRDILNYLLDEYNAKQKAKASSENKAPAEQNYKESQDNLQEG